jgi:hypothetical protein
MDRDQAKSDLNDGHAIRQRTWWWGRYVKKLGSILVDENAKPVDVDDIFVTIDGWERYRDNQHGLRKK